MSFNEIKELLINRFGTDVIIGEEHSGLQPALIIEPEKLPEVCMELRNNSSTYFDFLSCITAVDYGADQNKFGVVYHIASIPYKSQLVLKVIKEHSRDNDDLPVFPSVASIWHTAEWHEREAYDLVGIYFEGNQDLRRILLPDDWAGHPLRKDYKNPEYYKGIKVD